MEAVWYVLGSIIYGIAWAISKLTTFLVVWLINIAQWNNFTDVTAVETGWVMVRNLANMFFILILLVIAFATILRIENYSVKRWLPKLIIMAILVNFSKMICGLIIDASQIIMMTFIKALSDKGSNSLIDLLGIADMWEFAKNDKTTTLSLEIVGGLFVALIATLIALVVIIAFIGMLVMRIIMMWIYVVLSPLAYLMSSFPQGQKYASQWWGEFIKNVITGPVLAFFLWLALSTAQTASSALNSGSNFVTLTGMGSGVITGFLAEGTFQTYIITVGFLVGGLVVTQQIGGVAARAANKGSNFAQKGGKLAFRGARGVTSYGLRKVSARYGTEFRPTKIMEGIKESFAQTAARENTQARAKAGAKLEKGGMSALFGGLGAGADGANAFLSGPLGLKGFKNAALSTVRGKGTMKKAKDRYEELQGELKDLRDGGAGQDAIAKKKKEIRDQKKHISKIMPHRAFDGRSAERALLNEEKKKAAEFTTSDELVTNFRKAMDEGNTHRAMAIGEHLAETGDLNELLADYGHGGDAKGVHNFVQENLVGKNGMSEQDALRYQNYLSSGAQKAGQWNMAKTVSVDVDGTLKSNVVIGEDGTVDDSRQVDAAAGDMAKMDPQNFAKLGRLAFGGEDADGENYELSNLGKKIIGEMGHAFADHDKRVQTNTAEKILSSSAFKDNRDELLKGYSSEKRDQIEAALQNRSSSGTPAEPEYHI